MAKKSSKKESEKVWVCPSGCEVSNVPCPHLEKLLPSFRPLKHAAFNDATYMTTPVTYISVEEREKRFRDWIARYMLPIEAVDFLVARMIDNKPLEQVAKEQSFTNKMAAHRFELWIKKTLKERGLKPKGKNVE